MDRQQTVESFRARVRELIDRSNESRSAFAAKVGMDRSTLSQLLSSDNDRLPRAETVVAIARAEQVSCDWLLGAGGGETRVDRCGHEESRPLHRTRSRDRLSKVGIGWLSDVL